jgi:serine/threonine protein phosphatase 1
MSRLIIGDVHGCLATLKALIAKLPHQNITFVGDLVDRGPSCVETLEFVMSHPEWDVVAGNHEYFCLDHLRHKFGRTMTQIFAPRAWKAAGGNLGAPWTEAHLDWILSLPLYREYDLYHENGRRLFVSHACPQKWSDGDWDTEALLWSRKTPVMDSERYFVFGHTPVDKAQINDRYALIDTACVFGNKLTALQFPEMVLFQQDVVDEDWGPICKSLESEA